MSIGATVNDEFEGRRRSWDGIRGLTNGVCDGMGGVEVARRRGSDASERGRARGRGCGKSKM